MTNTSSEVITSLKDKIRTFNERQIVNLLLFTIGLAAVISVETYSAWNRRKRRLRRARRVSKQRKS